MSLTGPVIPKTFHQPNSAGPTPTVTSSIAGEIITCSNTGRMWVNNRDTSMVPVRPEFTFTNLGGETLAGVRSTLFGSAPFQSCGVEIYGGGLRVGRVESSGDVISTSTMQCAAFSMNSTSTFSVTTSSAAANPIHLRALKPTMSNDGTTATGANRYWFSVTNSLGCEFGDSGGVSGTYRLNAVISGTKAQFERVIEANDGVKLTDLPSAYILGTDVNGTIVNGLSNFGDVTQVLATDLTLVANTALELGDLRVIVGTAGQTQKWLLTATISSNHSGNHNVEFKIQDHTNSVDIVGSKTSGSAFASLCGTSVYTITGEVQFRVWVQSSHTATIQRLNGLGVPSTTFTATRLA